MTAKIITFTQQKGGAGKSLITLQLGFALERLGYNVALLDMGHMNAISRWYDMAVSKGLKSTLTCTASADWRFQKDIEHVSANGADFILVDTASMQANDTQTQAALLSADLSLIPFQPGVIDEWAVDETVALVNKYRLPYRMVRNRSCIINKPYTAEHLMPFVLENFISDNAAYINSLQSFTTLEHIDDSDTALEEMALLAQEICALVYPEEMLLPQTKASHSDIIAAMVPES